MRIRTLFVLAVSTAMVAVFPSSAFASAPEWTEEGSPITESQTLVLRGPFQTLKSSIGSYQCETVDIEATVEPGPGAKGEITSFTAQPGTCWGTGFMAGCKVTESAAEGKLSATAQGIELKEFVFVYEYEGCSVPQTIAGGDLSVQPIGGTEPIEELGISGTLHFESGGPFEVAGTFEVVEPTIGIS